jgi:hypothetical protein
VCTDGRSLSHYAGPHLGSLQRPSLRPLAPLPGPAGLGAEADGGLLRLPEHPYFQQPLPEVPLLRFSIGHYLLIVSLFGRYFHSSWSFYYEPSIIYLSLIVLLIRSTIGSQSWKFHKEDKELFEAVYAFSSEIVSKRYRKDQQHKKLIRMMDKMSRQIALAVYFLACFVAA